MANIGLSGLPLPATNKDIDRVVQAIERLTETVERLIEVVGRTAPEGKRH